MNLLNRLFKVHTHKELQQLKLDNEQLQLQLDNLREQQKQQVNILTTQCNKLSVEVIKLKEQVETLEQSNSEYLGLNEELEDKLNQLNTSKQLFITKLSDISTEFSNLIEDYSSK